ncbi:MAG: hypothetical protein ACPG4Q_02845 [Phycisphaeraceae bacterium]
MANAWQGSGTSDGAGVGISIVLELKRMTRTGAEFASTGLAIAASVAVWIAASRSNSSCCPISQCSIAWIMANCWRRSAAAGAYVAGRAAGSVCSK